jgi:hypothetical protein
VSWEAQAAHGLRLVLTAGGIAVALVLALKIAVPAIESRLTFFPRRGLEVSPDALGLPFDEFEARAADGVRLHGWFIPGAAAGRGVDAPAGGAGDAGSGGGGGSDAGGGGESDTGSGASRGAAPPGSGRPLTLLLFHGNAENIADALPFATLTRRAGYNLLLLDYRGYGRSEGSPSERGIYLDGEAALAALQGRPGVDPERIVLWGRSIGAAVAVHLAATRPVRALVLESPFTSVRDLLREGGYWILLGLARFGTYRFDSAARMPRVTVPVLVIHGTRDEIVPFALGRRLHDLAPGRKELLAIEGGGHNDLLALHAPALWSGARRFLATLE